MVISLICFSKDRPLQLEGFLTSLFNQVVDTQKLIHVLEYITPLYRDAYEELHQQFPTVLFHEQTDFLHDIEGIVGEMPYTMFCCDDVVFIRGTRLSRGCDLLEKSPEILGVSLRLGFNIERGFFSSAMKQPAFHREDGFLTWSMEGADQDWCYPWDVLGTIYRTSFVQDMLTVLGSAQNPSQFEEIGSKLWPSITPQRYYASWETSRTVVPTVNTVQNIFPNGIIGNRSLSSEFLLVCWQLGLRMDTDRLAEHHYDDWRIGDFVLQRI